MYSWEELSSEHVHCGLRVQEVLEEGVDLGVTDEMESRALFFDLFQPQPLLISDDIDH